MACVGRSVSSSQFNFCGTVVIYLEFGHPANKWQLFIAYLL